MNKINFDGRLLEGKDIQKKIHDIAYEMDFSGKWWVFIYLSSKKILSKILFYSY